MLWSWFYKAKRSREHAEIAANLEGHLARDLWWLIDPMAHVDDTSCISVTCLDSVVRQYVMRDNNAVMVALASYTHVFRWYAERASRSESNLVKLRAVTELLRRKRDAIQQPSEFENQCL
jgi:hypothetical protein